MNKPILCLDFDGVIHSYTSGWKGIDVIPDPVVPGFFEWAEKAAKHFKLVIYSSRSKTESGRMAMTAWLIEQRKKWREQGGMHTVEDPLSFEFSDEKPPAFLTIDDRARTFYGDWTDPLYDPEQLIIFRPWNAK